MRTFETGVNNDLVIGVDGNVSIVSELAAVAECCEGVMQARLNEMVFQFDEGLPFEQAIWVGAPNLQQFEAVSRARLSAVLNVTQINEFSARMDGDTLRYTAEIQTTFGRTSING